LLLTIEDAAGKEKVPRKITLKTSTSPPVAWFVLCQDERQEKHQHRTRGQKPVHVNAGDGLRLW